MDVSAFPYLIYFIIKLLAEPVVVYLALKAKDRPIMWWVAVWNFAGMARKLLIVLSAGPQMPIDRAIVVDMIRALEVVEAVLFVGAFAVFVGESVSLPGNKTDDDHRNA